MEIFPVGKPVLDKDLVGRQKEIEKFLHLLKTGQSFVLSAPRRYGKTSILLELQRLLALKKEYTAYVDIFACANRYELATNLIEETLKNKKIVHFLKSVKEDIKNLIERLQITGTYEDIEYALKIGDKEINVNLLLKEALELPEKIASKEKRKFYVFLDEFGDIQKYDGQEVLKLIRSIIQKQKHVVYIFAGSQESIMKEIFYSKGHPFFQFALNYDLGPIDVAIFKKYLINKFETLKMNVDREIIESILDKTRGHPFYTMLLSKLMYLKICIGEDYSISELISEAIYTEKPYFESLWEKLSEKRNYREVIKYLVRENQKGMFTDDRMKKINLSRILRDLQNMGFIKKRNSQYEFIDPIFFEYVQTLTNL